MSNGMKWGCGQFDTFKSLSEPMRTGVKGVAGDIKRMKDFLDEVAVDPAKKACLCKVIIAVSTIDPVAPDAEEQAWERITEDFEPYDAVLTKMIDEFPDILPEP